MMRAGTHVKVLKIQSNKVVADALCVRGKIFLDVSMLYYLLKQTGLNPGLPHVKIKEGAWKSRDFIPKQRDKQKQRYRP